MKKLEEYSKLELAQMNEEEEKKLVRLEAAMRGIPLKQSPPILQDVPEMPVPKTKPLFVVEFAYSDSFAFETEEQALTVLAQKPRQLIYEYHMSQYYHVADQEAKIVLKDVYDHNELLSFKEIYTRRQNILKANEELMKEWTKDNESYKELESEVHEAFYAAYCWKNKMDKFREVFASYLDLAKRDMEIATGFFKKAYSDADYTELVSYVADLHVSLDSTDL